MSNPQSITEKTNSARLAANKSLKEWTRSIPMYVMILPGFLYFVLFKYLPMGFILIAFQEYDPFEGFLNSPWVGVEHFQRLFTDEDFWRIFQNTLILSALNLFLFFPAPIVLALLLNEARKVWFRRTVQTITYMPHFLSWVVVVGVTILLFATQEGSINKLLSENNFQRIELMTDPDYFRSLFLLQNIWKETGWSAIIFLAALASIDPTLYEASVMDGASRWRQVWHINLPALKTVILILFVLRLGHVMDLGFEHVFLLQNTLNLEVSDVFDTYVYRTGVLTGSFSYTTAVGLFKSLIGLILIIAANTCAKKYGEEGVY